MDEARRLQNRIDELDRILGQDRSLVSKLRAAFDLTPDQGRILGMMLSRHIASHEAIFIVMYGALPECDQPEHKTLDVQISYLRRKLLRHGIAIKTIWAEGYVLTPEMKARVHRIVAQVAAEPAVA